MFFLLRLPSFIPTVQFKSAPFAHPGATTCGELLSAEDGGIQTEKLHRASGLSIPFGYFTVICFSCNLREREGNRRMLLFSGYLLYQTIIINVFSQREGGLENGTSAASQFRKQRFVQHLQHRRNWARTFLLMQFEVGAPRRPLSHRSAVPLIWSETSRELKAVNSGLRWENFEGIGRQSSSRWLLFP